MTKWIWLLVFVSGCCCRPEVAIYVQKDWNTGDHNPVKSGATIVLK